MWKNERKIHSQHFAAFSQLFRIFFWHWKCLKIHSLNPPWSRIIHPSPWGCGTCFAQAGFRNQTTSHGSWPARAHRYGLKGTFGQERLKAPEKHRIHIESTTKDECDIGALNLSWNIHTTVGALQIKLEFEFQVSMPSKASHMFFLDGSK